MCGGGIIVISTRMLALVWDVWESCVLFLSSLDFAVGHGPGYEEHLHVPVQYHIVLIAELGHILVGTSKKLMCWGRTADRLLV